MKATNGVQIKTTRTITDGAVFEYTSPRTGYTAQYVWNGRGSAIYLVWFDRLITLDNPRVSGTYESLSGAFASLRDWLIWDLEQVILPGVGARSSC